MAITASEFSKKVAGGGSTNVLDDFTWTFFGYKKRPRRGAFFQRFMKRETRLQEIFLTRELFITGIVAGISVLEDENLRVKIGVEALNYAFDVQGVMQGFGFNTKAEAMSYMIDGVFGYASMGEDGYNAFFVARARLYTEDNIVKWIVPSANYFTRYDSYMTVIKKLNEELLKDGVVDDIPDQQF